MVAHKVLFVMFYLIIIFWGNSPAVEPGKLLSLDDCISMALKNNCDLKIQEQAIREARAKSSQVSSLRLPRLDFDASYLRFSDVMEANIAEKMTGLPFQLPETVLRFGDEDNYSLKFSLSQPLFTGFKLSNNLKASQSQVQAELAVKDEKANNLIFQVKQTYYHLLSAFKLKEVAATSLHVIEAYLKDLQAMYQQGMLDRNEVLKVEIKKAETELLINQANNKIAVLKNLLLNLTGIALDSAIDIDQDLEFKPMPTDFNNALEKAYAKRPELAGLAFNIQALDHVSKAARGEYFPMISLVGAYEYGKPGLNKLENEWMDYWTVGIAAKWNIWDWGNKGAQIQQAKASLEKLKQTREKIKQQILLDVQQAFLQKQEAEQRVAVYQQVKLQAEENFRLVGDRFHQGLEKNTDFLNAEAQLTKAKIDEVRAIADFYIAVANFERTIGDWAVEKTK